MTSTHMSLFAIIGYQAEVSEPNGPAVHGYFLDRWGQEAQQRFETWLAAERSRILLAAANKIIKTAPPRNSELRYDGTEDPIAAAAVQAYGEAFQVIRSLASYVAAGGEL